MLIDTFGCFFVNIIVICYRMSLNGTRKEARAGEISMLFKFNKCYKTVFMSELINKEKQKIK